VVYLLTDPVKKKPCLGTKFHGAGCGRRAKVFRRQPVRLSHLSAVSNQLIDTDYWKRSVWLLQFVDICTFQSGVATHMHGTCAVHLWGCRNCAILCAQNFVQNWPLFAELTKRHRNCKILKILFSNIALGSALMAATASAKHFCVKVTKCFTVLCI